MPAAHAVALRTGARPPRARRDRSRIGFARPSRWKGWRRGAESAHPVCSVIAERGIRLELHGALVRAGRGVAALDRVASTDLRAADRLQARPCAAGEAAKIERDEARLALRKEVGHPAFFCIPGRADDIPRVKVP